MLAQLLSNAPQFHSIKLIAMVGTKFFGITSNPSMYTQGELGGVTQELVQHNGQTSPYGGENQIHKSFARGRDNDFWHHTNPSMYTQREFRGVSQELGKHNGQTSPNAGGNQTPMSFARISNTIL
jgi:hypothetical protein